MIQEYLFYDKSYKDVMTIYGYNEDVISMEITDFGNGFIVRYETQTNNEEDAKILSDIDNTLKKEYLSDDTYRYTTLTNGASAYFNKRLYPRFNSFERKLRKLLYLGGAISDTDNSNSIKDLESQELGKIFEFLFTDTVFTKDVRMMINQKLTYPFSKNELLEQIEDIEENTVWNEIIGNDKVSVLVDNYSDIRSFRNDVMHAHNINYEQFKSAKKLIDEVNSELDYEIGKLINPDKEKSMINIDFSYLSNAFKNALEALVPISQGAWEGLNALSKIASKIVEEHDNIYKFFISEDMENEYEQDENSNG